MLQCTDISRSATLLATMLLGMELAIACTIVTIENPVRTRFPVQLHLLQNNQPLTGANVEIYLGRPNQANDLPYESLITGSDGTAVTSELSVALYYVQVLTKDGHSRTFTLDIPLEDGKRVTDHGIELYSKALDLVPFVGSTGSAPAREQAKILQAWLRQFRGTVVDPAGAPISNVEIDVYATTEEGKDPVIRLKTDNVGAFSTDLEAGEYVVAFKSPGFVNQRVAVSMGPKGWRGMQLGLGVSSCPGINPKSTIVEVN